MRPAENKDLTIKILRRSKMLKLHTKTKSVTFTDKNVSLTEKNDTEYFNKLLYTDNLSISEKTVTFTCGPYFVAIKGNFSENMQKMLKYAFYGDVEDAELKVKSISIKEF